MYLDASQTWAVLHSPALGGANYVVIENDRIKVRLNVVLIDNGVTVALYHDGDLIGQLDSPSPPL